MIRSQINCKVAPLLLHVSLCLFWLEPNRSRHKEANRRAPMSGLILGALWILNSSLQKLESPNDVTWDGSYLFPKVIGCFSFRPNSIETIWYLDITWTIYVWETHKTKFTDCNKEPVATLSKPGCSPKAPTAIHLHWLSQCWRRPLRQVSSKSHNINFSWLSFSNPKPYIALHSNCWHPEHQSRFKVPLLHDCRIQAPPHHRNLSDLRRQFSSRWSWASWHILNTAMPLKSTLEMDPNPIRYPSQLFLSIFWLYTSDRWMLENLCIFSVLATLGAWPLSWASSPWHGALLCGHRKSALRHWAPASAAWRTVPGDRTVIPWEMWDSKREKKSLRLGVMCHNKMLTSTACHVLIHGKAKGWQLWSANEVYGAGEQWGLLAFCNSFRS